MKVKSTIQFSVLFAMIFAASLSRLIPHAPNFTAVGAMALFAGSMWGFSVSAVLVPLVSLALTDMIFGSHATLPYVYLSVVLMTAMSAMLLKTRSASKVAGVSLAASLLFYFVTNFGVWMSGELYASSWTGLWQSLVMGLPFLSNQVLGDLSYSAIMFGSYELLSQKLFPILKSDSFREL